MTLNKFNLLRTENANEGFTLSFISLLFSCFIEPVTLYICTAITHSQDERYCSDARIYKELTYLITADNNASQRSSPELEILRRQQIITSSCTLHILWYVSDCFRGLSHTHPQNFVFNILLRS